MSHSALAEYRTHIAPLIGDVKKLTITARSKAVDWTLERWGISKAADGDDVVKYHSALSAAKFCVNEQAPHCLEVVVKAGAEQYTLDLLNEHYEVDGTRFRLGNLTPKQIRETVLVTLYEQQTALAVQVSQIHKMLRRCKEENKPVIEQI